MIPSVEVQMALGDIRYKLLAQLDTGGVFECLAPNCCTGMDTEEGDKAAKVEFILQAYQLTGTLPTDLAPFMCCPPLYCGQGLEAGTVGAGGTFTDLSVTDDLTVGGGLLLGGAPEISQIRRGTGTLAGGTLAVAGTWVTATTRIVATYVTASPAADANLSVAKSAGVGFTVTGEGTHVFDWIAVV